MAGVLMTEAHRGIERAIAAIAAAVHLRLRRPAPEQQQKGWNGSGNNSRQIHRKPLFELPRLLLEW